MSCGTPCEPLKSAFRWAEEAQGDKELLSILTVPAEGKGSVREATFSRSSVAVASAALKGDLERLKDIFESDNCWCWRRLICQMFSSAGLLASMWSWHFACRERVKQTSQFALRVVVDGRTRVDGGF